MEDTTWIATIAGIALGIGVILAFLYMKSSTAPAQSAPIAIDYDVGGNPIRLREIN